MTLVFETPSSQTLRTRTSKWQSDFTTEVTIAPSKFRHRDFADEKYLKKFKLFFHTENSQVMQARVAKNQGDLREMLPQENSEEPLESLRLVFKPLDKEEEMGPEHAKAYAKGVNRQYIDKQAERQKLRQLRNTYPELMQQYDPQPKLFKRNVRPLKANDKTSCLGEYIDPRPCVVIDRIPEPISGA